ncbi:hypothetical protein ACFVR1_05170 [Psychrobacillus sp. NPDC058041]|uniref:hypothetical protein n=1 Tax=Psychrobacillus sp. NPDC058041 TaxID=3346310 RepID=UPI0036DD15D5
MSEYIFYYGIIAIIVFLVIGLFKIAKKNKDKKISFVFTSLGINMCALPLSFFIGGMATDSGDLSLFWNGFFFVQGIPLLILLVSIFRLLIKEKKA